MSTSDIETLLRMLKEAEELLQFPGVEGHYTKAATLLIRIARNAPTAGISDVAMRAVSRAYRRRNSPASDPGLNDELKKMRDALAKARERAKRSK